MIDGANTTNRSPVPVSDSASRRPQTIARSTSGQRNASWRYLTLGLHQLAEQVLAVERIEARTRNMIQDVQ
jgi:hypothetical protein